MILTNTHSIKHGDIYIVFEYKKTVYDIGYSNTTGVSRLMAGPALDECQMLPINPSPFINGKRKKIRGDLWIGKENYKCLNIITIK